MILNIDDFKFYIYEQEFKIFSSIDKYLIILEQDENTYEWDLTKDIKKDIFLIKKLKLGFNIIKKYINKIFDKLETIPDHLKTKLFKSIVLGLVTITSYTQINDLFNSYFNNHQKTNKETVNELQNIIDNAYKRTAYNKPIIKHINPYNSPITYSDQLIDFLKHEEGSIKQKGEPVLKAYKLGDGMITIGYGHAERISQTKMKPGVTTITKDKALELLQSDIKDAQNGLDKILNNWKKEGIKYNISQGMYDSMISMIFNMGIGNFRKSDFIQLVKQGKYDEAKQKILNTNVSYPGHIPRRKQESEMFDS